MIDSQSLPLKKEREREEGEIGGRERGREGWREREGGKREREREGEREREID